MPPRLVRGGHPVGRRRPQPPTKHYFCNCDLCCNEISWSPLDHEFRAGRSVGRKEFLRHNQLRKAKANADQGSRATSPTSPDSPAQSESSNPNPTVSSPHPPSAQSTQTDRNISHQIRKIEEELAKRITTINSFEGLIFIDPPCPTSESPALPPEPFDLRTPHSDINAGPYALVFERRANRPILEYLLWLHDTLLQLDGLLIRTDHQRTKRGVLIDHIEREFRRVEDGKAREWARLRAQQDDARVVWRQGHITVVDTGKLYPS